MTPSSKIQEIDCLPQAFLYSFSSMINLLLIESLKIIYQKALPKSPFTLRLITLQIDSFILQSQMSFHLQKLSLLVGCWISICSRPSCFVSVIGCVWMIHLPFCSCFYLFYACSYSYVCSCCAFFPSLSVLSASWSSGAFLLLRPLHQNLCPLFIRSICRSVYILIPVDRIFLCSFQPSPHMLPFILNLTYAILRTPALLIEISQFIYE